MLGIHSTKKNKTTTTIATKTKKTVAKYREGRCLILRKLSSGTHCQFSSDSESFLPNSRPFSTFAALVIIVVDAVVVVIVDVVVVVSTRWNFSWVSGITFSITKRGLAIPNDAVMVVIIFVFVVVVVVIVDVETSVAARNAFAYSTVRGLSRITEA